MKLKSSVQIALIIVAGIILLTLILIFTLTSVFSSPKDSLQVNGQSTIKVTPDLITLSYNVETKGNTSKEAENLNSDIVNDLIYNVVQLGFDKTDLKTENFNIYPEYDWQSGEQKLLGYKAVHSLKIELTLDEMSKAGELIDAGTNAGTGISYINFELSPELEQEYKAKSIKLAASDAKIKAEAIADGFDKKVGKLVSVSLSEGNYYSPWRMYDSVEAGGSVTMAKEAVANVQPSEKEITAYVSATYKLK